MNGEIETKPHLVMLVDDEPNILSSLQRLLRREGYEIVAATSARQALESLESAGRAASVVVSDFRMPEMDGVQFLSQVRARYPDTVRIVLSGYADSEMVQSAINDGHVYKFLGKPWDDDEIREVVRACTKRYEAIRSTRSVIERMNFLQKEAQEAGLSLASMSQGLEADGHLRPLSSPERGIEYATLTALRNLVNAIPAAIIGADLDELIVLANPWVERVLGLDRRVVVGNSIADSLPSELAEMVLGVLRTASELPPSKMIVNGHQIKIQCRPIAGEDIDQNRGALLFACIIDDAPDLSGHNVPAQI